MFVRLSYHNIDDFFILYDAGVIDLNTKCQVSLSQIEDYGDFGWLELTSKNLEVICEYCAELGIVSNILPSFGSLSDFRYWYSEDMTYHLELKSDQSENLDAKVREINLKLWDLELIKKESLLKLWDLELIKKEC